MLTKDEQDRLTPNDVLQLLREGNARFVSGTPTERDDVADRRASAAGQHPMAVVLSCLDSRVPVELVFDCGIGDVFVARIAGNFVNRDILGSAEFACKVVGAKLFLVLGHEACGAVKGAIDEVELGNLTGTLANIRPAVERVTDYRGERTSGNAEFVHLVAEENVRLALEEIWGGSEVLRDLEVAGAIGIVGGMYDLQTGRVHFFAP